MIVRVGVDSTYPTWDTSDVNESTPTGLDLKVERVRRRVKATQIALQMGVSKSRVAAIERDQFPSAESVARYRAALATCAPSATSDVA